MLSFGKCLLCCEKDNRIEDLKAQIDDLKRLLFSPNSQGELPIVNIEANQVLDASDQYLDTEIQDPNYTPEEIEAEANRILTGAY